MENKSLENAIIDSIKESLKDTDILEYLISSDEKWLQEQIFIPTSKEILKTVKFTKEDVMKGIIDFLMDDRTFREEIIYKAEEEVSSKLAKQIAENLKIKIDWEEEK